MNTIKQNEALFTAPFEKLVDKLTVEIMQMGISKAEKLLETGEYDLMDTLVSILEDTAAQKAK